jgi:hypothetical protein
MEGEHEPAFEGGPGREENRIGKPVGGVAKMRALIGSNPDRINA